MPAAMALPHVTQRHCGCFRLGPHNAAGVAKSCALCDDAGTGQSNSGERGCRNQGKGMARKSVGSGLTRFTENRLTGSEWLKAAATDQQFLARVLPTYPERLLQWRQWATKVLARAGRPTSDELVQIHSDGTWRPADETSKSLEGNERMIAGLSYSDAQEESSIEWYASKILRLINVELALLRPQRRQSTGGRLSASERRLARLSSHAIACELGSTVERVRWKFAHEAAALAGYLQTERLAAFQKRGAETVRAKGAEKEKKLEPLFRAAIERSSKPLNSLTVSSIIELMRKIDPKVVKAVPPTTLRRYVERLCRKQRS